MCICWCVTEINYIMHGATVKINCVCFDLKKKIYIIEHKMCVLIFSTTFI